VESRLVLRAIWPSKNAAEEPDSRRSKVSSPSYPRANSSLADSGRRRMLLRRSSQVGVRVCGAGERRGEGRWRCPLNAIADVKSV
jgi:hypothetical protein